MTYVIKGKVLMDLITLLTTPIVRPESTGYCYFCSFYNKPPPSQRDLITGHEHESDSSTQNYVSSMNY